MTEPRPVSRFFGRLTLWCADHALIVILLLIAGGAFGVWRAKKLKINQDLKVLIPDTYASVQRLEALGDRIGSQSEMIVELRSPNRDAAIAFGDALAARMGAMSGVFRSVEWRREVDWFKHHALLFLPTDKLLNLRARVIHRIREEVEGELVETLDDTPPPATGTAETQEDDPLDLTDSELQEKYGAQYEVPSEFIETQDGADVVMVLRAIPTRGTTDVAFSEKLVDDMRALLKSLDPSRFDPNLQARIKGEYEERTGEVNSIKDDLLGSTLYALAALLLILVLYFKRLRAIPLILGPLVLATLLTLGIATYVYDYLNLVTAFIFVVLLGLGIDFGIHLLTRYEYERLRGATQREALSTMGRFTAVDVTAGAVTTALMFSLFPIADFRGFSQFGVIACIGVVVSLVFTVCGIPAFITASERLVVWKPRKWLSVKAESESQVEADTEAPKRPGMWRPVAVAVVLASVAFGAFSAYHASDVEFEYDFTKLGKRPSSDTGPSGPAKKTYEDAIGRPNFGPAAVLAKTADEGALVEDQLRGLALITDTQMARLLGHPLPQEELKHNDPNPDDKPPPIVAEVEEDEDDPFAEAEPDPFADLQAQVDAQALAPETQLLLETYPLARVREMRYFRWKHLSLWSFVPRQQATKLAIIADIRKRVDAKYDEVSSDAREKLDRLKKYLQVDTEVGLEDVPRWVRDRWTDKQGKYGRHTILWNRGAKANYHDAKRLQRGFFDLKVGPDRATIVPVAANYFVLPDIMDTLGRDGPRVLAASMLAIFLCLLLMFRSLRLTLLILVPLVSSIAWLAGLFYLLHWKLNLYNVITFALIVGMGVDDGIHMVSRWVEEGRGPVRAVLRETGAAITLTTLTTCIGFAGLLYANHIGLNTLGWTAALGMGLCYVASVTTLPALLSLLGKRA